jgi:xanthine dehydrogenase accessory factor
MKKIVRNICRLLDSGEGFVLATILSSKGSTPRTSGTKMIVRPDGRSIGTVGGGVVEAHVIRAAREVFDTSKPIVKQFRLNAGALAESMDVICGGELAILIEPVAATRDNVDCFRALEQALTASRRGLLVADLTEQEDGSLSIRRNLLIGGQHTAGESFLSSSTINALTEMVRHQRSATVFSIQGKKFLVEPVCDSGTVYIFGAGHVSRQLAILTQMVDFRTVVLDDREEFANRERFASADDIRVLKNFENPFDGLIVDADSYVVIVTRGHHHDKVVLAHALKTRAGYIGMIGSRRKRDTIYKKLLDEGFTDRDINRVHSPIGLDINAETPQEIAVSIVSELIAVRAGKN